MADPVWKHHAQDGLPGGGPQAPRPSGCHRNCISGTFSASCSCTQAQAHRCRLQPEGQGSQSTCSPTPHPGPGEGVCSGARWVSEARWPVGGGGGALVLDRWGHGGEAIRGRTEREHGPGGRASPPAQGGGRCYPSLWGPGECFTGGRGVSGRGEEDSTSVTPESHKQHLCVGRSALHTTASRPRPSPRPVQGPRPETRTRAHSRHPGRWGPVQAPQEARSGSWFILPG